MALTKAKLIELIDNGDIDVGGGGGLGQNLLHNWDFRNPVNQRGISGYWTGGYNYDRWSLGEGVIYSHSNYIEVRAGARLVQSIEGVSLAGRVVTVSAFSSAGILYSITTTVPLDHGGISSITDRHIVFSISHLAGRIAVQFKPTTTVGIAQVKLELGTVSTLHLDPPMDSGAEIVKCRRYFMKFPANTKFYGINGAATYLFLSLPTIMRVIPSDVNLPQFTVSSSAINANFPVISSHHSTQHLEYRFNTNYTGPGVGQCLEAIQVSADL